MNNASPMHDVFQNYNRMIAQLKRHHEYFSKIDPNYEKSDLGTSTRKVIVDSVYLLDKIGLHGITFQ